MKENPIFESMNKDHTVDFAISYDNGEFVADVFNAKIDNANQAYIESISYNTLEEAKQDMNNYIFRDK